MELEQLAKIIANVMNIHPEEVLAETDFVEDLGADSLDVYQIIIGIEEELQIEISADDAEKVRTVEDVLRLVGDMQEERP